MASIEVVGVSREYADDTALHPTDLTVPDGEFLVVAGPSGSGKTTLLRLIAGLETPSTGAVLLDGRDVTHLRPEQRNLSMVFQDYALYAHRTALRNITFPLEVRGVKPGEERERRAVAEARLFAIEHLLERVPGQLSAGHRQAVATARALVRDSEALLMDEPLHHLDAQSREKGRVEVRRLHRDLGKTVVYVTNDQREAMTLGDRVAVLDEGRLQQVDTPLRVFDEPANTMVAGFIGTPPMSLVPAELAAAGDGAEVLVGTDRIRLADEVLRAQPRVREWFGRPVLAGIRPQHLAEQPGTAPFERCLHGAVVEVADHGDELFALVDLGVAGARVHARYPPGSPVRPGDRVELLLATERVRFFDPADGRAI